MGDTDQILLGKEILSDFKSHQLYVNQSGLTSEMLEISTGLKARPLSHAEDKAKLTVELYGETAAVARDLWREIRKTHPGANCYSHSKYGEFSELRTERNSLAHTILENYSLHREFVAEFAKMYGINKLTIEAQSKQFLRANELVKQTQITNTELNTQSIIEKQDKLLYNKEFYNYDYGKYTQVENRYNTSKYAINADDLYIQNNNQHNQIDYALIKQELNSKIKDLAYEFLGKPQQQKATEWRYGNKGSISIHVAGIKKGLYANFETGESGNALKLIQDHRNLDYKEAFKWGMNWLGHDDKHQFTQQPVAQLSPQAVNQSQKDFTQQLVAQSKNEWTPVFPAPNQEPNIKQEKQLAYMLKGRQETARFTYKDADQNVLGYVVRLEDKHGNKITPTLTYCRNKEGKEQWRWQGFGNDRPLYGLEQLKEKPNASVLIVEGEKTANAAQANPLFKDMAVVTWSGGAGAVQKSDWSVLKDKNVIVWPDNDKPGLNAAHKTSEILKKQGHQNVKIVDLPATLPYKWDLADKVPEGVNIKETLEKPIKYFEPSLTVEQQKEKSIIDYMNAELDKGNPLISSRAEKLLREKLAKDPMGTLETWKVMMGNDKCFTPLSFEEMTIKTYQAEALLKSQKVHMNNSQHHNLQEVLKINPQAVINDCQKIIQVALDRQRISDFTKYTELAKEYKSLPLDLRNSDNAIFKQLDAISNRYEKDVKFNKAIENNDLTRSVQYSVSEIKMNESKIRENKTLEINRGFER